MANIKINGKDYDSENLSDEAKSAINALRFCDAEVQRLKLQQAALQAARGSYEQVLARALASGGPATQR